MFPVIYTDDISVLVIGGGRAADIKVKTMLKFTDNVSCWAKSFSEDIKNVGIENREIDFYDLTMNDIKKYNFIYICIPFPSDKNLADSFKKFVSDLKSNGKLVCVCSSEHELGNIINPCTRITDDFMVSVTTYGKSPRRSRELADKFIGQK